MNDGYFPDSRDGMKWDVSPFKAKDVPAFVATPSSNWSSVDCDQRSIFRSRLHSSPYLDDETLRQLRPGLCGPVESHLSPRFEDKKQIRGVSSQWPRRLAEDSDSGVYLQQTHFYDTVSSNAYSMDSGIQQSSISAECTEPKQRSGLLGAGLASNEHSRLKDNYSFDPLAPPFKPRGADVPTTNVPFRPSDVKAIDVAKSIASAYRNEFHREEVLRNITNLSPTIGTGAVPLAESVSNPTKSPFLQRGVNSVNARPQWREQCVMAVKPTIISRPGSRCEDEEFFFPKEEFRSRDNMLAIPNPITTGIRESPIAKGLISEAADPLSLQVDHNFGLATRNTCDGGYQLFSARESREIDPKVSFHAFGIKSTKKDGGPTCLINISEAIGPSETAGTEFGERKKVTFDDIVNAGIKAINKHKLEDSWHRKVDISGPLDIFEHFYKPSAGLEPKFEATELSRDFEETDLCSCRPSKYRTEPCTTFHTIGVCPYGSGCNFYHDLDEKNEAPVVSKTMRYKTRICKTWQKAGDCPYGVKCDFAHGTDDLASKSPYRPHYKTRMCKVFQQTGRCPYGAQCTFAHKQAELRTDNSLVYKYKTEMCKSWAIGMECSHGRDCHFAHGENELDRDPFCPENP